MQGGRFSCVISVYARANGNSYSNPFPLTVRSCDPRLQMLTRRSEAMLAAAPLLPATVSFGGIDLLILASAPFLAALLAPSTLPVTPIDALVAAQLVALVAYAADTLAPIGIALKVLYALLSLLCVLQVRPKVGWGLGWKVVFR